MEYILMNKNTEVMEVSKDINDTVFQDIGEIYNIEYAPLVIFNNKDKEKNDLLDILTSWYDGRAIPNNRDNKNSILEHFKINKVDELLNLDYGLSLSDQYWLKPVDEEVCWDDINYFLNEYDSREFFDATYGEGSFQSLKLKSVDSDKYRTPNNSLTGQLKKTWIKVDGEDLLFKGAVTQHGFEQINEVLATMICEALEVPHVTYRLCALDSKRHHELMSVCPCIVNDEQEIISAYDIVSERDDLFGDERDMVKYIAILEEHGVPNAGEYVQKMFMLDYLILNEDRHMRNFGILRNVETLEWESVCPVYDSGRSMCTDYTELYWIFENNEVKCFTNNCIDSEKLVSYFDTPIKESQIASLRKVVPEYIEILKENQSYIKLFDNQIDMLKDGLNLRIDKFESIMREKGLLISSEKGIEGMIEKAKQKKEQCSHIHERKKEMEKIR